MEISSRTKTNKLKQIFWFRNVLIGWISDSGDYTVQGCFTISVLFDYLSTHLSNAGLDSTGFPNWYLKLLSNGWVVCFQLLP